MQLPGVLIRPATDDDTAYVIATWVRSHVTNVRNRMRRERWREIAPTVAPRFKDEYVMPALAHGASLLVACSERDPRTLHGWVCTLNGRLVYGFVTSELRTHGIARALVTHALGSYPERIVTNYARAKVGGRFHHEPLPLRADRRAA